MGGALPKALGEARSEKVNPEEKRAFQEVCARVCMCACMRACMWGGVRGKGVL